MPELLVGLSRLHLPAFTLVEQRFDAPQLDDVATAVRTSLADPLIAARLRPGATVALAIGSRGICNLRMVVATTVAELQRRGVSVIIIPAMGSHGGATAAGQADVLARLGVAESTVGAAIHSAMDTVVVAHLRFEAVSGRYVRSAAGSDAIPVHMDAIASRVDAVIPIVRVKPHTGFRGRYESGICKMLCIGLGKHDGCSRFHREGYGRFSELIPAAGQVVLDTGKIACAIAVVENAHDAIAHLEAVPPDRVMAREPELLEQARRLMPRLLLPRIDVLVIEEFGKDVSGVGMDPGVTGRGEGGRPADYAGPEIRRIVVLGLTPNTHGNATGLGMADVISERVFTAIDRQVTATNVLTSGSLAGGRIPLAMPSDELAILAAASCLPGVAPEEATIVRIQNTLKLSRIAVSANLLGEIAQCPGCMPVGPFTGAWDATAPR
jgi:hypothetical protein